MNKVTDEQIRAALRERYCQPEYELVEEVEGDHGRRADAIAVNMWPSRNNAVTGFEIKVSKSDLKRELMKGAKAEALERYCNYWVLVLAKGITKDLGMVIPENWGILEYDGEHDKLTLVHQPEYKKDNEVSMRFSASLLRAQYRNRKGIIGEQMKELRKEMEGNYERRLHDEIERNMEAFGKHNPESDYMRFREAAKKANIYIPDNVESYSNILRIADKLQYEFAENGCKYFKSYFESLINFTDDIANSAREQQRLFNETFGLKERTGDEQ